MPAYNSGHSGSLEFAEVAKLKIAENKMVERVAYVGFLLSLQCWLTRHFLLPPAYAFAR